MRLPISIVKNVAWGLFVCLGALDVSVAAPSAQEFARLGTRTQSSELTPVGAIRAGNAAGTIPAWDGGIQKPPAGYVDGGPYVDPYADDKILYTITAKNYKQYEGQLSQANIEMFKKHPDTYTMNVYPTRRSASYPDYVYDATLRTARTAEICNPTPPNENCVKGIAEGGGYPFPMPKQGMEVMYNHMFQFIGKTVYWPKLTGHLVGTDGSFVPVGLRATWAFPHWMTNAEKPKDPYYQVDGGAWWLLLSEVLVPAKDQGQLLSVLSFYGRGAYSSYLYLPGQRRVRKAPDITEYDQPGYLSDGIRTADGRYGIILTGDKQWFDWKLVGRKEVLIPYNNYKLTDPSLPKGNWKDLIRKGHINRDLVRYELHRVWEIEGTLREGFRHIHQRITAQFDEDSWGVSSVVRYDARGRAVLAYEQYPINYYNLPATWMFGDSNYDLVSGRYYNMENYPIEQPAVFNKPVDYQMFTPQGMRALGRR